MTRLLVRPQKESLRGSVPVPSDKSIGHRAVIFAALARDRSVLRNFSGGEDNWATVNAFRALGVACEQEGRDALKIDGVGLTGLKPPQQAIDCGNSGTTMRLLSGILCAQPFVSRLVGDQSLSRRPMGRIAVPLRSRGAIIEGKPHPNRTGDLTAPLEIGPRQDSQRLAALEYTMPIASAQVKSALLLSGLFAAGPTVLVEPLVSRDHTERMMDALRLPIETVGSLVSLHPPRDADCIEPFEVDLPGDLSAAAFLAAAGLIVQGSQVTARCTGLNPTRSGFLDIIRHFSGSVQSQPTGAALGETYGDITVYGGELRGTSIGGEMATRAIDEIPIACALAARASGSSSFYDVAELRVKESDRIASMVTLLRSFGVEAEEHETGLHIQGVTDRPLTAARVSSSGDHRIAMTAAVLGLVADGETIIDDVDCIATSFPRFVGTLRALGAEIEVSS